MTTYQEVAIPIQGFDLRLALVSDIPAIREIECAAGQLFREVPELAFIADDGPSMPVEEQEELVSRELLWVVGDQFIIQKGGLSQPCGFLAAKIVDESLHICELSVSPKYQRRGFSRNLIAAAALRARSLGLRSLSLTTDRYVPWNGPMYARQGFREVAASELGPEHIRVADYETELGLDIKRRYTMALDLDSGKYGSTQP